MGIIMVTISALSRTISANSLQLFKTAPSSTPQASTAIPTVRIYDDPSRSTIAQLAAKLFAIKADHSSAKSQSSDRSGASTSAYTRITDKWNNAVPRGVGKDGPLTSAEKAEERAAFENYYKGIDNDIKANFDQVIPDLLLSNDLYVNDQRFQDAYKNGTLKIQHGEEVAKIPTTERQIIFNSDGRYAGVASAETSMENLGNLVEMRDGRMVTKADGKNAAIGGINNMTFFVTW